MTLLGRIHHRFWRARRAVLVLFVVNLAIALPAAAIVREAIHEHIKKSAAQETLRHGFDTVWYVEFAEKQAGLSKTFRPGVVSFGAFLDNLDSWWSGKIWHDNLSVLALAALYGVVWLVAAGGILSALGRGQPVRARRLWKDGVQLAWRFAVVAGVALAAHWIIQFGAEDLFMRIGASLRDVTDETTARRRYLFGLAGVVLLIGLVHLISDLVKVVLAVEGGSPGRALGRAVGIFRRHFLLLVGVHVAVGVLTVLAIAAYAQLPTIVTAGSWGSILGVLALGQLLILLRLTLRVWTWSAQAEIVAKPV